MDISGIALQGLQQADLELNRAASKIVSWSTQSIEETGVDTVDLSSAVVALMSAKNAYSVDLKVLKTAGEIQAEVADLLSTKASGR
jgi:hypothetical protein